MMKTQKKCLITGGTGFIGSHLCDELIKEGYEVICLDNLITGSKDNISHLLDNPKFKFILHDITKPLPDSIKSELTSLNSIFHFASVASPPQYRKYAIETLLANSLGTYITLQLAQENNADYILASTSEIYGNPQVHPQKESYFGNVNSVGLRACYDESKRFAEAITVEYFRKHNLRVRIVRIFNTYGPRMQKDDGRVISNFIGQAIKNNPLTVYGDGKQTRSFCFISDMVEGILKVAQSKDLIGEVINLGNPDEYSIDDIGEKIIALVNSKSTFEYTQKRLGDDPDKRKPDITKAKQLLGWEPKVSLAEGLLKTIAYFKNL